MGLRVNFFQIKVFSKNNNSNSKYLELTDKVYEDKKLTIYPFIINISNGTVPSKLNK